MNAAPRLAQYVQPNLPEARIAHQWAKLENADRSRRRFILRPNPAWALGLAAIGALVIGLSWHYLRTASSINGITVENARSGLHSMTLPDGSHIELAAASRVVIDEYSSSVVRVSLQQGQAKFQVAHSSTRHFNVLAAGYEISVMGTSFTVQLEAVSSSPHIMVRVDHGRVSVRARDSARDEKILSGGESWTDGLVAQPIPELAGSHDTAQNVPKIEEVPMESAAPVNPLSSDQVLAPSAPSASARMVGTSPKELFEMAEQSRISGRIRDSADALNKLRRHYRSDPRAGLAAFELGRLRMDVFGDLTGGTEALRDAISLSPGASFREDAEARLVQLYHRQGNRQSCVSAKADYLKHFPNGAASKVVSQLCGF